MLLEKTTVSGEGSKMPTQTVSRVENTCTVVLYLVSLTHLHTNNPCLSHLLQI